MKPLAESMNSRTKIAFEKNCATNSVFSKVMNNFDTLCSRLIDDIIKEQLVTSERLEKFGKFVTFFIRNHIAPYGAPYEQLNKLILEYWHYDLSEENNRQRGCSYVQLYQMIIMIQHNCDELKSEYFAYVEAKKRQHNVKVIKNIKESPGITFKNLLSTSSLSAENLREQLEKLENQNFLVSRRTGDYQRYRFTYLGEILYQDLCSGTHNIWADQWDSDRMFLLVLLIFESYKCDKPVLLCDLVNYISSLDKITLCDICQSAFATYKNINCEYITLISLMVKYLKYNDFNTSKSLMEQFLGNNSSNLNLI